MSVATTMPAAVNLTLQRRVVAVRTCRPDVELELPKCCLCAGDVAAPDGLEECIEIVLRRRRDGGG